MSYTETNLKAQQYNFWTRAHKKISATAALMLE